jgi:hypothetical protein
MPSLRPLGNRGLTVRPLAASALLVCTAVGALVVIGFTTLALVPLVLGVGLVAAWLMALALLSWAGIEGMAALERWFENDPRFQR